MAGSIKGSGFESAVQDVKRLVADGVITPAELEERLTQADRNYLAAPVMPSLWYPLDSYERIVGLLLDKEGRGDPEYLVDRGRRAAERLTKAGVYSQLDATIERWGESFGKVMATLGGALFSGTEWSISRVEDAGSRYRIDVKIPAGFPECARLTSQGFIESLGTHARGARIRVDSHRPSATRMSFVTRDADD